jgi:hypothetical protein
MAREMRQELLSYYAIWYKYAYIACLWNEKCTFWVSDSVDSTNPHRTKITKNLCNIIFFSNLLDFEIKRLLSSVSRGRMEHMHEWDAIYLHLAETEDNLSCCDPHAS